MSSWCRSTDHLIWSSHLDLKTLNSLMKLRKGSCAWDIKMDARKIHKLEGHFKGEWGHIRTLKLGRTLWILFSGEALKHLRYTYTTLLGSSPTWLPQPQMADMWSHYFLVWSFQGHQNDMDPFLTNCFCWAKNHQSLNPVFNVYRCSPLPLKYLEDPRNLMSSVLLDCWEKMSINQVHF